MKRAAVLSDTALYPQAAILTRIGNSQSCAAPHYITFIHGATHVNVNNVYRIYGTECILIRNALPWLQDG